MTVCFLTHTCFAYTLYLTHTREEVDIFKSQKYTGVYSDTNCVPTCVYMALKLFKPENTTTIPSVHEIREAIWSEPEGCYLEDAYDYLTTYDFITTDECYVENLDALLETLKDNVVILLFNPLEIKDKHYTTYTKSRHALLITGFYKKEEEIYLEVYDPLDTKVRFYEGQALFKQLISQWVIQIKARKEDELQWEKNCNLDVDLNHNFQAPTY